MNFLFWFYFSNTQAHLLSSIAFNRESFDTKHNAFALEKPKNKMCRNVNMNFNFRNLFSTFLNLIWKIDNKLSLDHFNSIYRTLVIDIQQVLAKVIAMPMAIFDLWRIDALYWLKINKDENRDQVWIWKYNSIFAQQFRLKMTPNRCSSSFSTFRVFSTINIFPHFTQSKIFSQ